MMRKSGKKETEFRRLIQPPGREESLLKAGGNYPQPVVSARSPPVTCGYLVYKAVENRDYMRTTSHNLWIRMWIEKMPGEKCRTGLASCRAGAVEKLSPLETALPGGGSGTWEE
jgi:hypothetical protein